jgi:hypothetical protein
MNAPISPADERALASAEPDPVLALVANVRAAWVRLGEVIEKEIDEGELYDEVNRVLDAAKAELLETPPTTLAGARAVIA